MSACSNQRTYCFVPAAHATIYLYCEISAISPLIIDYNENISIRKKKTFRRTTSLCFLLKLSGNRIPPKIATTTNYLYPRSLYIALYVANYKRATFASRKSNVENGSRRHISITTLYLFALLLYIHIYKCVPQKRQHPRQTRKSK